MVAAIIFPVLNKGLRVHRHVCTKLKLFDLSENSGNVLKKVSSTSLISALQVR